MAVPVIRSLWPRVYRWATWVLIGLFGFLAVAHVVLTALFYVGVVDQGHGFFFSYEWPGWSISVLDALAAVLLWIAYRRGTDQPWLGLGLTLAGSIIIFGRAAWMVFAPVLAAIAIGGSVGRIVANTSRP